MSAISNVYILRLNFATVETNLMPHELIQIQNTCMQVQNQADSVDKEKTTDHHCVVKLDNAWQSIIRVGVKHQRE